MKKCPPKGKQPLNPEPQPLVQKQEFLAGFRRSGRQFLLRNIEQWEEARHHCSICRQWLARPADFKSRLKKSHQALWQQYGTRAEKLVSPTTLNGKCEICHQSTSGNTKHRCPVLFQVHFASLIDDGGRCGHASSATHLDRAPALSKSVEGTSSQERSITGGSQGQQISQNTNRKEPTSGAQGQRISGQKPGRPAIGEGIGQSTPTGGDAGQTGHTPRRRSEPSTSGSRILSLFANRGLGGDDHTPAVPHISEVEGESRAAAPGQALTFEGGSVQHGSSGSPGQSNSHHVRRGIAQKSHRSPIDQANGGRERRRAAFLDLFGLRPQREEGNARSRESSDGSRANDPAAQGHSRSNTWRDDRQISWPSTAFGRDGGGAVSYGPGDFSVQPRSPSNAGRLTGRGQQLDMEAGGSSVQEGPRPAFTTGGAAVRDDQGVGLQYFMQTAYYGSSLSITSPCRRLWKQGLTKSFDKPGLMLAGYMNGV